MVSKTSYSDGHTHNWSKNSDFTSTDKGTKSGNHKHPVNIKKKLALPAFPGGHKHILFGSG